MLEFVMLLAAQIATAPSIITTMCQSTGLRISVNSGNGDFNGMSHSGAEIALRNIGPDCILPALPLVMMTDTRGHVLPVSRRPPVGMHPGPVMIPVTIQSGKRATVLLSWVSAPVFDRNRSIRASRITVRVGRGVISAPLKAIIYGDMHQPVTFEQTPFEQPT